MSEFRPAKLGGVAKFIRGITFKPEDKVSPNAFDAVVCMRTKNVQVQLDEDDIIAVPREFVKRKEQFLQNGDILVSTANSWELVGKCSWVEDLSYPATAGGFIAILRANPETIAPRYLYHWLASPRTQCYLRNCGRQTTNISNMSYEQAELLEIPIPYPEDREKSLPEQKRIAAILDKADAIRRKRKEALALADDFLKSVFLNMFGKPEARGWPISYIRDIVQPGNGSIRTGPFGSQLLHSEFVDTGVAVLGIDNAVANEFRWGQLRFITQHKYDELRRYTVRPGDVLITIMGTCGRCAIVPNNIPRAITTKHLCCITLDQDKCLSSYLHSYFLLHPMARQYLKQTAKGAIMAGLNMGLIKEMPIPIPPIDIQTDFAKHCEHIHEVKRLQETATESSEALFSSLAQRAFRGEL